jgi:hypothetical protein
VQIRSVTWVWVSLPSRIKEEEGKEVMETVLGRSRTSVCIRKRYGCSRGLLLRREIQVERQVHKGSTSRL